MAIEKLKLSFNDPKTRALAQIMAAQAIRPVKSLLVVGCGKGIEAAILADALDTRVTGIDIDQGFDREASKFADLRLGDALKLDFRDECFDAVYSFHALEHIPDHKRALREMHRVLCKHGVWLIGTPNKDRILGYIGSKSASLSQKIIWNVRDWKARMRGEFRNECGAHAGFSADELRGELTQVFSDVNDVTRHYYAEVYSTRKRAVRTLALLKVERWAFPAVYFVGRR